MVSCKSQATVEGGFGGGFDVALSGAGLGDADGEVDFAIEVCGQPCDVVSHSYAALTCRPRPLLTPSVLAEFAHSDTASLDAHAVFIGAVDDFWTERMFFDGDLAGQIDIAQGKCEAGLQVEAGGYALFTELRFYPPVLNRDRDAVIGGIFEARNSSGSWVAVYEITSRPRAGWNTVDTGFSLTQAAGGQG